MNRSLSETVLAIVGDIEPAGECYADAEAYKNLQELGDAVYELLGKIVEIRNDWLDSDMGSCEAAAACADGFITSYGERICNANGELDRG